MLIGIDSDNVMREVGVDKSGALKEISLDHAKIHEGKGFNTTANFAAVANDGVSNIVFKTPATGQIHMRLMEMFTTGTKYQSALYEAPTNAPADGTNMNVVNRNRISENVTSLTIKHTATINTAGATTLDSIVFGGEAPLRPLDLEYVLKPDTWYIRTFTNKSGGAADINIFMYWYEV
jgi:hypothetical protein